MTPNGHPIQKLALKQTFVRYFVFVSWYQCIMSDLPDYLWITELIIIIITIITKPHMSEMSNQNFENIVVNWTWPLGEGSSPGRCFLV